MLIYLLDDLKHDPNPPNVDPSPLKYCIRMGCSRLSEILIHYGAYYIFDDVCNNVEKKVRNLVMKVEEPPTYVSLVTGKEVPISMIVKDADLRECPMKEVLRWARVRNLLVMKKIVEMVDD